MSNRTTSPVAQVFLGGSCDPTDWRMRVAIPALQAVGVTFYNPQVNEWHEGLVALEAAAKEGAEWLLFVIDGETRAIASILEATETMFSGRNVVLVIDDIPDGTEIGGQTITGRELKDLNRARAYLRDAASRAVAMRRNANWFTRWFGPKRGSVKVCATVQEACEYLISSVKNNH